MTDPVSLDLVAARRWALAARSGLAEARERINALNVFPVPDGDTGTNMFLTLDGAIELLRGQLLARGPAVTLRDGLSLLARGTLLAARGNSGVILSQLSRGLHEVIEDRVPDGSTNDIGEVDAKMLARAFAHADTLAWDGVTSPVEGTILSVSRAASRGADAAARGEGASAHDVAAAALAAATDALQQTPQQLPILARAGVVDAGGAGYVILIEALERVLSGRPPEPGEQPPSWLERRNEPDNDEPHSGLAPDVSTDQIDHSGEGAYEVMYLVTGSDPERAGRLRAHLSRIGSSVLVVGGPDDWRVHVHLDHPDAAVEAGGVAGHLVDVAVVELFDGDDQQATHPSADDVPDLGGETGDTDEGAEPPMLTGAVGCAPSAALGRLFAAVGVAVVHSAPGSRASTGELLSAIRGVDAPSVVLLPNDPDTILAAHAAARLAAEEGGAEYTTEVVVIPTASVVQGLSAMAVWSASQDCASNEQAMSEAANATRYGAVTVAGRDADTDAGPCRVGQYLSLHGRRIAAVSDDLPAAVAAVLDELLTPESELLTVVRGAGALPGSLDAELDRYLARNADLEVVPVDGEQDADLWLFGVE